MSSDLGAHFSVLLLFAEGLSLLLSLACSFPSGFPLGFQLFKLPPVFRLRDLGLSGMTSQSVLSGQMTRCGSSETEVRVHQLAFLSHLPLPRIWQIDPWWLRTGGRAGGQLLCWPRCTGLASHQRRPNCTSTEMASVMGLGRSGCAGAPTLGWVSSWVGFPFIMRPQDLHHLFVGL